MDKIYKSFSDKNRRMILTMLKDGDKNVNQMLGQLDIGQATLSSHLHKLRRSGLVSCRTSGKQRIYKIEKNVVLELLKDIQVLTTSEADSTVGEIILRRKTV